MKPILLEGPNSLVALRVFTSLLLGLNMLPAYSEMSFEQFLNCIYDMSPTDQEKIFREALMHVPLDPQDILSLGEFILDANGVPYAVPQMKKMALDQMFELVVVSCKNVASMRIKMLTESEKKNLKISA